MTSLFSKPKAPDTSKQEAALAAQDEALKQREKQTALKDAATAKARRGRASARASLITGGNESGVMRTSLG